MCIVLTALLPLRSDLLLVSTKGIFPGRNDSEADAPILWPPDVKSQLIRKDPLPGLKAGREGDDRGRDG